MYDELASVYEFLVPEPLLDARGSFAAFRAWVDDLPRGAPVLDCACGPGHLAVGSIDSPMQCMMNGQPHIARWISEHAPIWTVKKWYCSPVGRRLKDI